MKKIFSLILTIAFATVIFPQTRGNLMIIGGGSIPDYLIEKYVELAGGKDSKILIIPMASGQMKEAVNSFNKKLMNAGCSNAAYVICTKETADNDTTLAKLKEVKGVFFTGGDQSKLTSALAGTRFLNEIKNIYKRGGVIGGTSAGAAVMSDVMITGEELISKDTANSYNAILKGNIQTARGFGFIDKAIIDQHFIKRKRMNRLVSIVLENPKLLGIGIDESTCVIVKPEGSFEVLGESLVNVFDATGVKNIKSDKKNHIYASDIKMHLLGSGDKYFFNSHKIIHKAEMK